MAQKKITELVTAIKNFFKQLFSSRKKVEDKIKEAKNVVARVKVKSGSTSSEAFDPKSIKTTEDFQAIIDKLHR